MRPYIPTLILALALTGCAQIQDIRKAVYSDVAERGNQYCVVRDPMLIQPTLARVNGMLRAGGAQWQVAGEGVIECDPEMPPGS